MPKHGHEQVGGGDRTVVADRCTLAILSAVLIVAGCTTPSENLQFRSCTNECTTNHNACVAEATEPFQLESCNTEIRSCAAGCEKDHGLYIDGAGWIGHAEEALPLAEVADR